MVALTEPDVELPVLPPTVLAAMQAAINDSYKSGRGGDTLGGFHEEGGLWYKTTDGKTVVIRAKPGKFGTPHGGIISINLADTESPVPEGAVLLGDFHVHPSGVSVRYKHAPDKYVLKKRYSEFSNEPELLARTPFDPMPSEADKTDAANYLQAQHWVLSTRAEELYLYNKNGILQTIRRCVE
jgi:hypothetical protein